MVRAHVKRTAEEKKISSTKKRPSTKAKKEDRTNGTPALDNDTLDGDNYLWHCRISGCSKKFAREADLKRHQRTSKAHPNSQPILCPQCDSTFTRTDALRRHQKSRHNGVFIAPLDSPSSRSTEGEGEGDVSPSRRRNLSPPQYREASSTASAPVETIVTQPDAAGPSTGPQSYYRPDAINAVFVPPYTPIGAIDASVYPQPQLPISTTKFHSWVPNSPWIADRNGTSPAQGATTQGQSPPAGYYAPGAYYRSTNGQPLVPANLPPPGILAMQVNPNVSSQQSRGSAEANAALSPKFPPDFNINIDPSLQTEIVTSLPTPVPESTTEQKSSTTKQETDALAGTGLRADIQKVIKAVLAIDSERNLARTKKDISAPGGKKADITEASLNDEGSYSLPNDKPLAYQLSDLAPSVDNSCPSTINVKEVADPDADGDADTDAEEPLPNLQKLSKKDFTQTQTQLSVLPDGIKELINEDSLA